MSRKRSIDERKEWSQFGRWYFNVNKHLCLVGFQSATSEELFDEFLPKKVALTDNEGMCIYN